MSTFKGVLLTLCLLITAIQSGALQAQTEFDFHMPGIDQPVDRPLPTGVPDDRIRLVKELNETFLGNTTLNLNRVLKLGPEYRGHRLQRIVLHASSQAGPGTAQLVINGENTDTLKNLTYQTSIHKFLPYPGWDTLGTQLRTIEMKLQGRIFVQKVIAILTPSAQAPRVQVLRKDVYRDVRGGKVFDLRRLLKMGQDMNGRKLLGVSVQADSVNGAARARILLDGRPVGQTQILPSSGRMVRFKIPRFRQTIGTEFRTAQLEIIGSAFVRQVSAHVTKLNRPTAPPVPPTPPVPPVPSKQDMIKEVRQNMKDGGSLSLAQIMSASEEQKKLIVKSVIVRLIGQTGNEKLRLCASGGVRPAMHCGERQSVPTKEQELTFGAGAALERLSLASDGKIKIRTIKIIFQ